jgi:hypothetical protein
MATNDFQIEIIEQGWLEGCSPEEDLCSHGKIKLTIGGHSITSGHEDYGISESALALLRTLGSNHSDEQQVAQRLIFHGCGTILMMGCPIGVYWSVTHLDNHVRISDVMRDDAEAYLTRFPGLSVDVPEEIYRQRIVAFAEKAKEPFNGVTKTFTDDFDRREYEKFWAEYDLLLKSNNGLSGNNQ